MIDRFTLPDRKACFSLLFLLAVAAALPACNTIEGAGQDIEATGDAISDTARETKEEMTE